MEKIILDYIVDNINRNKNKEALNNDVLLLEAMVENNKIEDDYTILLKDSNEKIDLREFLEKIYKETSNKKIMDILSSNKLAGKTSNNFSYLLLMDKIEELKEELDEEKIKKVLDDFFTGSKNKKIANYLVEDGETKLFSLLLKYILTSSKGLFLFKTLFFDFLKIEKKKRATTALFLIRFTLPIPFISLNPRSFPNIFTFISISLRMAIRT